MDYGMLVRNQRDKTLELSGRPKCRRVRAAGSMFGK